MLETSRSLEAAEAELNSFIERRALKNNAEQQRIEDLFEETTRRHREKRREEHRLAWYCFHLDQAERLHRTMTALIEKHEAAAAALLEGEAPFPGARKRLRERKPYGLAE